MQETAITIAIPTYNRNRVLIDTIRQLLSLERRAAQILIVDQTRQHDDNTEKALADMQAAGEIEWIRLPKPSITAAMNMALKTAQSEVVLFLDDDIELTSELVAEHARCYQDEEVDAVVGRVVQPWQQPLSADVPLYPEGRENDPDAFRFNGGQRAWVQRVMAGNLSVRRSVALAVGGFDENFVQVAYRFEAEFADRLVANGHRILFEPDASIKHLKVTSGGTRTYGEHLRTARPAHSVGRYYYLLVAKHVESRLAQFLASPFQSVATRFHLTHPWWIPLTFLAELSGMAWAIRLYLRGPCHVNK